ncbi:thiamine biosynthesis/tRNA modification protein ThiI [Methanohalobium evestigatum Z-7303]|uniref:Probable tRNA sulfurtransferase n=1 Tax=Methanohalobium evestigatum (strain ATCC BAA-1072 / DSM 3721 / NBRC 107634 / OCM 161 / Z-7303) TaxID=644295 RepID=D7EA36_METEZ|nr:tRNA uracil 4-sulfurtransferase ThiI [Methanohalobium evestigatum]ADI74707.1 thiamine biosynthesis/tRNA modification protein ThiI [Methanohalobium evestigatum Z-7303]
MTDYWLVRYSEIFLKSNHVQKRWVNKLVDNIQKHIPNCHVKTERGRIWLYGDVEPEKLKNVFGIRSYSPCIYCPLDELSKCLLEYCENKNFGDVQTFALRIKRVGAHDFSSQDKARELGNLIRKHYPHLKVDLDNPEKEIFIEIRDSDCYLFSEKIAGPGGIPLGVEGSLVALMSGGIDSPVAAYMMMKRGCSIIPIYVDIDPYLGEKGKERAFKVVDALKQYQPGIELEVIGDDYLYTAKKILKHYNSDKYTCLICKRRLYRIAEDLANKYKALGIVTGDSLGQVASQTLDNLYVLDEATNLPVYRPLIGFDKEEVIDIARRIGTYSLSTISTGGCGAVPEKPATKAKLDIVKSFENLYNE